MSTCAACLNRTKSWTGDDPQCGFSEQGEFSSKNWNCATLNALRDLVYEGQEEMSDGVTYQFCDNQKYASVNISNVDIDGEPLGLTLWVSWYKDRGTTDALWLLDDVKAPRHPTEEEVRAILAYYGRDL